MVEQHWWNLVEEILSLGRMSAGPELLFPEVNGPVHGFGVGKKAAER